VTKGGVIIFDSDVCNMSSQSMLEMATHICRWLTMVRVLLGLKLCPYTVALRYDTMQYTIFMCTQKLANRHLNLPHGTKKQTE